MGLPELPETTESEEMYLITVAQAVEEGPSGPVPVAALASALGVSAVSANEKVHKLTERGLVTYSPYKGVELTPLGVGVAWRVLRTRRLWATFLVDRLGYHAAEADSLACRLEHATPPDAAERLAAFLGDPRTSPLGRPIPPADRARTTSSTIPLTEAPVGAAVEVAALGVEGEPAGFLAAHRLLPGVTVTVLGVGPLGLLVDADGRVMQLAAGLAAGISVVGGAVNVAA